MRRWTLIGRPLRVGHTQVEVVWAFGDKHDDAAQGYNGQCGWLEPDSGRVWS